jgi:hypothetical protein
VASPILLYFASGILPFGTMFIELYFAMTSLWLGYFYYLFGFVFIIGILTVTALCCPQLVIAPWHAAGASARAAAGVVGQIPQLRLS